MLEYFDCEDTAIAEETDYTKTIFDILKNLKLLDNKDKHGK
jgi:hypothetical protein